MRRQMEIWREHLLDLTRRQKLVYFKHATVASLEISQPAATGVLGLVDADRAEVVVDGLGLRVGNKTAEQLPGATRRLAQLAQQALADRGVWILNLGLGMLHWVDPDDGKTVDSPLVLVPVELVRAATSAPYRVKRAEESFSLNPALVLKLEREFGLELPSVDDFDLDLPKFLDQVADLVADREGWSVSPRTVLSTFTFLKEAMYRDLSEHETQIVDHPLVQLVALGPAAPAARTLPFEVDEDADLDSVVAPESLHSILDADSSQRRCILAAREGRSFVMDGPPGTGKSQTIANIIAELMATGRSVLFVSEKAAALDVVRSRLAARGLENFLLELHSHTANRRDVAVLLDKELSSRPTARSAFDASSVHALERARTKLTEYADAVNVVRPGLDLSLHTVLGQAAMLPAVGGFGSTDASVAGALTGASRLEITTAAQALSRSWRPVVEGEEFLWRGLSAEVADAATLDRLAQLVAAGTHAALQLSARTAVVDEELPLGLSSDLEGVRRRAELLRLLAAAPEDLPAGWFTLPDLSKVFARLVELKDLVVTYRESASAAAEATGPDWSDLDPDAASVLDVAAAHDGRWVVPTGAPVGDLHRLSHVALAVPARAVSLLEDVRALTTLLGLPDERISLRRATEIAGLARLAESTTPPEASWLNPTVHTALAESRRVLEQLVGVVRQRQDAVASVFTRDALGLDLVALQTRFRETHTGLRKFSGAAREDKRLLKAVTVAQRVTKETIAHLDEAIAWQRAEKELTVNEGDHAERLGTYWRGTDTDFGRLTSAIEAALDAVRLAGDELDARTLAGQLARGGTPDPALTRLGHRVQTAVDSLTGDLAAVAPHASALVEIPVEELAEAANALVRVLEPALSVVDRVVEVADRSLSLADARRALAQVSSAVSAQTAVLDDYASDEALFGVRHRGTETDVEDLTSALGFAEDVRQLVGGALAPSVAERLSHPSITAAELDDRIDSFDRAVEALGAEFSDDRKMVLGADLRSSVTEAIELLGDLRAALSRDVPEWIGHRDRRGDLVRLGLGGVVDALIAARVPAESVPAEVERAALVAWIDQVTHEDPRLKEYRSQDRDALVARFRSLDAQLVQNAHAAVVTACAAVRPRSVVGEAGQIRHEASKKSRHIPVRELLERAGTVAQQLKPCFMMSPLSVSQYLPSSLRFDVVIFDEASQVAPWDAVNCIYRGAQLIVAGDEKQLAPTAFFDSAQDEMDEEDDELLAEFESVLTACKGAGAMTALPLSWHYRSRHEDLITFSNVKFYEGKLNTFPGARFESEDLGVEFYEVGGVYDRGGRRDNVVEARAVVDRVVHHHRENPKLSVGVVALSGAQADAIERELEQRAERDRSLESLLERSDRLGGFFIKNLENVQGDERDVIIFSVGYGPDINGKITMNFGPLTRKGGWRRLNVAVTRARRRVEVVSSLTHGDIVAGANESIAHFRDYLHYADRGPMALALDLSGSLGDAESPFEEDVIRAIRSLGYEPAPQVGTAGYRIDIGVRHPDVPGEYVLGVECDGAAYHSAKSARDRDRLRQSVLEGLGWRIHRIWGISWWRDRAGQVERLRIAIEEALRGGPVTPAVTQTVEAEVVVEAFDPEARPEWARPYERFVTARRRVSHELHTAEARPQVRSWLEQLLQVEAPIHEELLLQRFREDFGVGRLGSRIKDNVLGVLATTTVRGQQAQRSTKGFWSHHRHDVVRVPADADTVRVVEHVAPNEVRGAVEHLVRDAGAVGHDTLVDAVRRLFGWNRLTPVVSASVEQQVEVLVARGTLIRSGDTLSSRTVP